MIRALISATLGLAMLAGPLSAGAQTVRIATEGAYAPYNFTNAAGELEGYEIDMSREACARAGLDCEYVVTAWDGIVAGLQAKKFDAIMSGLSINDEREKIIAFSHPYLIRFVNFVTIEGTPFAAVPRTDTIVDLGRNGPEDEAEIAALREALEGLTVGVQIGTNHERVMRERFGRIDLRTYDIMDNMIFDLEAGRIDVGFTSATYLTGQLSRNPDLTVVGPDFQGGPLGRGQAFGLRKEDQEIADRLGAAIETMIADGTLSELSVKWFGDDFSPRP